MFIFLWSPSCLDMEQFDLVPAYAYLRLRRRNQLRSTNFQNMNLKKITYQTDSLKNEVNEKAFAEVDSLVEKRILPSYYALKFAINNFGRCRKGSFTVTLFSTAASYKRKHSRQLFISLDAAGLSPSLLLNRKCRSQIEKKLGPVQSKNLKSCKGCALRTVLLMSQCST